MKQEFFAHGKLLLSGEYAVLQGARALAIPTKKGQHLFYEEGKNGLEWRSLDDKNQAWFFVHFDEDLNIQKTSSQDTAIFLQKILQKSVGISNTKIPSGKVETRLDFPRNWGLGSSSTLVFLIARWLGIDSMELHFASQNGSGFDVACAGERQPILYQTENQKAQWKTVKLPEIFEEVYFIHLNKKQRSQPEVRDFLQKEKDEIFIQKIADISIQMSEVSSKEELQNLMEMHEEILSKKLQIPTVKSRLFSDFEGAVKSLGAWGGDFGMALGENSADYFPAKGFATVVPFAEMAVG